MSDGVLQEVLRLEQAIAAELAAEQQRADAWLAEKQRAAEQQLQQQREALQQAALTPEYRRQLRRQAGERLRYGRARLLRLQHLSDVTLRQALQEVLVAVTGEGRHDRPDGQG